MPYSFRSNVGCRVLSLSLLAVLPGLSLATGYLDASGSVGALIGGPSDGYDHVKSPAFIHDKPTGNAFATATGGGYQGGFADIFGEASVSTSAAFGNIREAGSASARGYTASSSAGYGGNAGYASEVITIHGSGIIALTLNSRLIGDTLLTSTNNVIDGASSRVRSQVSISPSGYVDHTQEAGLDEDYSSGSVFDSFRTSTIYVTDGSTLRITGAVQQISGVQLLNSTYDAFSLRTVSALTDANLNYWVNLSPGASLSSESGYLYEAPAAVPEPTSLAALGLGAVAVLRRRKRRV